MAQRNDFRRLSGMDMRPVFISLGVAPESFSTTGTRRRRLFDAALNGGDAAPDVVWLFRGDEYYTVNLREGSLVGAPKRIAGNWGGRSWPSSFSSGIDAAVWAGPRFPNLWYFFKDDQYLRLNSSLGGQSWQVDMGVEPRSAGWLSARDTWFSSAVDVALHGIGSRNDGRLHLFRGPEYMRHNLNNGQADIGPVPIQEQWDLPDDFSSGIDTAFYGVGELSRTIYFFAKGRCALFDTESASTIRVGPIDREFPAFAEFMARPQLFLVENYVLETYVGPPQLGVLVETKSVPPGSETRTLMITEVTDASTTTMRRSVLDSQDSQVVEDFNSRLEQRASRDSSSEQYRYHMNADFHGDAEAKGVWGGEVNASLAVQGGSDALREQLAESTFETIGSQVTESTRQVTQRTVDSSSQIQHQERVLNQNEFVMKNDTDRLRVFEFYQQLQPYVTLLVLKDVRIGYADGTPGGLRVFRLRELPQVLAEAIASADQRSAIAGYVAGELSGVLDHEGQPRALVVPNATGVGLIQDPITSVAIRHADGEVQKISTSGLVVKAVKQWLAPTLTMTGVEAS